MIANCCINSQHVPTVAASSPLSFCSGDNDDGVRLRVGGRGRLLKTATITETTNHLEVRRKRERCRLLSPVVVVVVVACFFDRGKEGLLVAKDGQRVIMLYFLGGSCLSFAPFFHCSGACNNNIIRLSLNFPSRVCVLGCVLFVPVPTRIHLLKEHSGRKTSLLKRPKNINNNIPVFFVLCCSFFSGILFPLPFWEGKGSIAHIINMKETK